MRFTKKHIVGGAVGLFFLSWFCYVLYMREAGRQDARSFYHAEVSGRIKTLGRSNGVSYVKLMNGAAEWGFYPLVPEGAGYRSFGMLAQKGDSLVKHANDDTIYLYSGSKVYKYIYNKE